MLQLSRYEASAFGMNGFNGAINLVTRLCKKFCEIYNEFGHAERKVQENDQDITGTPPCNQHILRGSLLASRKFKFTTDHDHCDGGC